MKKSELKQIIKEEIQNILNEGSYKDKMDEPTKDLYDKYYDELGLHNWNKKIKELENDPDYIALEQNMKEKLDSALEALYIQLANMER